MVMAGRSVHLTTLFSWAGLNKQLTSNRAHTFACNWQQPFLNESAEGRRMTVEIISWSISTKVWDPTGIKLATPGSAVRHASVARQVTDCATQPRNGWFVTTLMSQSTAKHVETVILPDITRPCFSWASLDWAVNQHIDCAIGPWHFVWSGSKLFEQGTLAERIEFVNLFLNSAIRRKWSMVTQMDNQYFNIWPPQVLFFLA